MNPVVDLRSDTVTRPTAAMRAFMATAPVGDDVFGDDPSVNALQEKIAALLGKEAALYVASGTQSNLVAIMSHCGRGDEYIVGQMAHTYRWEGGGAAVLGSVQPQPLEHEADGRLALERIEAAVKPNDAHFARSRLLCLENTIGGKVLPLDYLEAATALARGRGLATHLDGARLLNAAVASGRPAADLARGFDLVGLSLSKGLGAPVGSMLAGSRELIERAHRYRRMAGGAMRQAGILAAAASYALENHVDRLADDHANARLLADELLRGDDVEIDLATVQTNIVVFSLVERRGVPDAVAFVERCRERGVLLNAFGPRVVRAVTHLDVTADDCRAAAKVMRAVADGR